MNNDEATADNQSRPAVGAPVQPSVRPLVERLRDGTYYGVQDLFDEAADEIERLAKERDDYERRWLAERRAVEATISGGRYLDGKPAW